jgi:hypothetical protein
MTYKYRATRNQHMIHMVVYVFGFVKILKEVPMKDRLWWLLTKTTTNVRAFPVASRPFFLNIRNKTIFYFSKKISHNSFPLLFPITLKFCFFTFTLFFLLYSLSLSLSLSLVIFVKQAPHPCRAQFIDQFMYKQTQENRKA